MTAVIDLTLMMRELSEVVREAVTAQTHPSWRERLWNCDPKTRLWLDEVAEALGRTKPAVRMLVKRHRLPCRRQRGELVFIAGEIRQWVEHTETAVNLPSVIALTSRRPRRERP